MCANILKNLIILIILFKFQHHITAYNLSPKASFVLKRPEIVTFQNKTRSSYFGYSIILREKSAFISAPRDQSSVQNQSLINEPGAVYKCALDFDLNNNAALINSCKPFLLDTNANIIGEGFDSEIRDYQWLGASMDGGPLHTDPLVICAPGFSGDYTLMARIPFMHGICYMTMYTQRDEPMVKKILVLNKNPERRSILVNGKKRPGYSMGQQGFSAHITKSMNEILMGAPGINLWSGSIVFQEIKTMTPKIPEPILGGSAYFGYAVSSGRLEAKNTQKIHYVASATHAFDGETNMNDGMVVVFDLTPNGQIEKKLVLNALQFGECFGYSLIVEDVTGDGLDEIIVSAPYHHDDGIDDGAVYFYVNDGDFRFAEAQKIRSPIRNRAQFGTTMAKLGDINRDGFNDIAISAPFADGYGAVAIFLGSAVGLQTKPSQILRQSTPTVSMFGYGLSTGFDLDDNGFNDLAIGAPEIEQVYIYQTYPIVDVVVSINTADKKRRVPLDDSKLTLEICYEIKTKAKHLNETEIIIAIQVDPIYKRIMLDNRLHYADPYKVNVSIIQACYIANATIKTINAELFKPMPLQINFTLVNDAEKYEGEGFCGKCVMLDRLSRSMAITEIIFDHGCGNKSCKVDLELTALDMPEIFILDSSQTLMVSYLIQNQRQNAFDTLIEFHSQFPFAKIPTDCKPDNLNETILSCSINGTRSFKGNMTLEIGFDVRGVQHVQPIEILAKATSAGDEENAENNNCSSIVYFQAIAAFDVLGKPNKTYESVYDREHARDVMYSFELQNNGPSAIRNLFLNFALPAVFKNKANERIRFVNTARSRASLIREDIQYKTVFFEQQVNDNSQPSTKSSTNHFHNNISYEYQRFEAHILAANSTYISLYCNQTKHAACVYARLSIPIVKPSEKLLVNLFVNIEPKAIRDILADNFDYLQAFVNVFFEPSSSQFINLNITNIIDSLIFDNIGAAKTPLWVLIAAAAGGVVFLILLTLILKMLGFFKRQTKEEMQKIIDEKFEKEKMKAALAEFDDEKFEEVPLRETEGEA